jgi:hypothetical protein
VIEKKEDIPNGDISLHHDFFLQMKKNGFLGNFQRNR